MHQSHWNWPGRLRLTRPFWALLLPALLLIAPASAQDPFEIHVYEYESLKPGAFTLETHLNYVGVGSKTFQGPVAPFHDQIHITYELTGGITDDISFGFMLLSARRPGSGIDYAGWRVLPHFYVPDGWHWPVSLGLVTEFSFQRTLYEENSRRVEIRPIIEKTFGPFQIDLNPVFARALHGPGTRAGWSFEPAVRLAYKQHQRFTPSLEYYSDTGPFPVELPIHEQVHQFLPGGDLKLSEHLLWSFGVGVGATSAGNRLVYKSRIELEFGRGKSRVFRDLSGNSWADLLSFVIDPRSAVLAVKGSLHPSRADADRAHRNQRVPLG